MLLVAMPKSASTSLMTTLGRLHDVPAVQIEFRELDRPSEIRHMHEHHPDIVELDSAGTERLLAPDRIYKQHIPPTPTNLKRLAGRRIVVLLRDPDEVIDAYLRAFKTFAMKPVDVERAIRIDDWRAHANRVGLSDDVRFFHRGWQALADDEDVLIVDFRALTEKPKWVLNEVERHLGLPETSHDVELSRQRYTRSRIHMLKRLAGRSARRIGVYRPVVGGLKRLALYRGSEHRNIHEDEG